MKRLCVFAHWDRDNIIEDYVIYYLKALKEVCSTIIFVSDTNSTDTSKLEGIADFCLIQKHGEYDFGSYKRGFFYALENNLEFEELLFVNDSCYGPFFPLKPIFDKMANKNCDFWGLTRNKYGLCEEENYLCPPVQPHIQSYFLLLKPQVFNSSVFMEFMKNITKEESKGEIIKKYEIGLSQLLYKNGFKSAEYLNLFSYKLNFLIEKWDVLIKKYKFPFLKTLIVKNGFEVTGEVKTWRKVVEDNTDYPVELIISNYNRLKNPYPNLYSEFNLYRKVRFWILKDFPPRVRYWVILTEKGLFKFLNTICFNKLHKF